MSIFGTYMENFDEDIELENSIDNEIIPTEECFYGIVTEAAGEIYKVVGALYIADAVMESQGTIVEEGIGDTLKSAKERVINAFKTLFAKIKAWFTKTIKNLGIFFTSSKKFIDKYKADIEKKIKLVKKLDAKSGTKYSTNCVKEITSTRNAIVKSAANVVVAIEKGKGKKAGNASTIKEDIVKGVNSSYSSFTDIKDALLKKCVTKFDGEMSYSAQDLNDMVGFLTNSSNDIKAVRDLFTVTSDLISKAIKKIKDAKTAEEISGNSTAFNTAVGYVNSISPLAVKIIESRNKHAHSVLKALLLKGVKTPKKESVESVDLFESAMNLY